MTNLGVHTCHVCRGRFECCLCDYCDHWVCFGDPCYLGDKEGNTICLKCQENPKHRKMRP